MQVNRIIAIFGTALLITAILTPLYVSVFQNNILVLMLFFAVSGLLPTVVAIRIPSSTIAQPKTRRKKRTRHNKSNNNKKAKRETGRIKFFNTAKQYGFITREDASDLYVQQRSLGPNVRPQHLTTGQVVTFEVAEVRGQKIARDVRVHKQET